MKVFPTIRRMIDFLAETGDRVRAVLVSEKWVANGYVFLVNYRNRFYILLNSRDLDAAVAGLPSKDAEAVYEQIWGIKMLRNDEFTEKVATGVYYVVESNDFVSRNKATRPDSA